MAAKRGVRERQVTVLPEPATAEKYVWNDLLSVLDEELSRLPDKYRVLIVLCDLEGMTRKEVARRLHIPEGTTASRLATARAMLAKRLVRRGIVLSGALLGEVVFQQSTWASVPTTVVSSTIKAAHRFAAGPAAGKLSVEVAALTEGVFQTMFLTKLKTATVGLLLVALLGLAVGAMYQARAVEQPKEDPKNGVVQGQPQPYNLSEQLMREYERGRREQEQRAAEKAERAKLEGVWEVVAEDRDGVRMPEAFALNRWVFRGDRATLQWAAAEEQGKGKMYASRSLDFRYVVNPAKSPPELTLRGEDRVWQAIYKLEKDTLTLSYYSRPEVDRPKDFSGKEIAPQGGHHYVYTLRRKPAEKKGTDQKAGARALTEFSYPGAKPFGEVNWTPVVSSESRDVEVEGARLTTSDDAGKVIKWYREKLGLTRAAHGTWEEVNGTKSVVAAVNSYRPEDDKRNHRPGTTWVATCRLRDGKVSYNVVTVAVTRGQDDPETHIAVSVLVLEPRQE